MVPNPQPIRLSFHAKLQCKERGASEAEVIEAIRRGVREPAKKDRWAYRLNFGFDSDWQGKRYAVKQVCPVVIEKSDEIVVVTVYTFYF